MTKSSHPPSLRRLAERTIRDEALFDRGDRVLVACSGGPDSTALLHVLALLRRTIGHEVIGHGVDHGLRPEAANELALAAELADKLGVPFEVTRLEVEPGGNLQARAREARHRALQDAAARRGAAVIATGHTADDKAETVLLRLLRGAGPRGLAVLEPRAPAPVPPSSGESPRDLVRPLVCARRSDVLLHLDRHAIAHARDPSNLDPRFTRVRVRRELIPLLEELSPRIIDHLCALADMLHDVCPAEDPMSGLGRAQRTTIERAQKKGSRIVKIRMKGGRELDVTFPAGKIVLNEKK
ncbi:tRNA lysidine(34) synthetase TilS [Polyangium jinanense]|uniref:tRNA(Ile)-lysidine synthase n=1 Tax=Polyangium jinanense TaxID=2829994 RepID=A0A9X4ANN4_9BACT|nr:tRNA lysidine(34) synthetase TilS [Polyangium jinanense]MDC3953806.1 tRNA lysidine(34) synthetase TilS [Polyangium jinanense]MDC3979073.1 tRNA lysidine(34) synthetase TilS [Polyangium jinanense]